MNDKISLAHGDGGELAHRLIQDVFVKAFGHNEQAKFDSALLVLHSNRIAVTTDSFTINPLFYPGGDIGKLAIAGTVNDLAVSGATPKYLTAGFIIEEGFSMSDLKKIVDSMAGEAKKAGVSIVTGDTKVVERGNADGIFINTTGIGLIDDEMSLDPNKMQVGDSIIIGGTIGDHGVAILSARGELGIQTNVKSDCSILNHMIDDVLRTVKSVRIMRDPTRGGLATTLVEICDDFNVTMELYETALPIRQEVEGVCDLLGYEAFYLANEGKVIFIVGQEEEEKVLSILRQHEIGKEASVIGKVVGKDKGRLYLKTPLGTTRRLDRLSGILLPRIC